MKEFKIEEFKARKIIESLESIAAEEGADTLTGEVIEECCKANGVDPEDFRNFICENIDLQKIKELQGLEELSLERLDQVAGGAQSVKRGIASFLAATSLLGSAANFTVPTAFANAKQGTSRTAQQINLKKAAKKDGRNKKKTKQNQKESSLLDSSSLIFLGASAVVIASLILYSQNKAAANLRAAQAPARYAKFARLLDNFNANDINGFCEQIRGDFPGTYKILKRLKPSDRFCFSTRDDNILEEEIGTENTIRLYFKLNPENDASLKAAALRAVMEHYGPSTEIPVGAPQQLGYNKYEYKPIDVQLIIVGANASAQQQKAAEKENEGKTTNNKATLVTNVNSGITRLDLNPENVRADADKRFGNLTNDPRRGIARYNRRTRETTYSREGLSEESKNVYELPEGYCFVSDYAEAQPIEVHEKSPTKPVATFWWYKGYSLPALFAVDKKISEDKGGQPLDPAHTAVQNAGNAVSPGGDILVGKGTQEESLMMDTDGYLFLNSTTAYRDYYLKNYKAMQTQHAQAEEAKFANCAVESWNDTGIFRRGIYCKGVGLRDAKNGETINMITTAAADYNPGHGGTYMGPKKGHGTTGGEDGLDPYRKQLICYWDNILRIAHNHGDSNIVLTLGGGGAYKGDSKEITAALFKVLTEYGPNDRICWARCFANIIFAADSRNVQEPLCGPYKKKFGIAYVRKLDPNQN